MKCPYCGALDSKVVDSRLSQNGDSVRRRRLCDNCQKRFTTYEVNEVLPIIVIKKNGDEEYFDSDKLMNGILRACEKRPVNVSDIEEIVENIEGEINKGDTRKVSSDKIGELTMMYLRELDEVAYVRFASVYREFTDTKSFMDLLSSMAE